MAASIPEEHRRGRYLLSQRLGVGDVAEVYLAQLEGEGGFRRDIVLKCLRPELGREPERVRLFLEEANLVAQLRHPNIVQALDLSRDGADYFMALELVDGPSLANLIGYTRGVGTRIPVEMGAHVIAEAARGLHYAHEAQGAEGQGVVHRDVRPGNILISQLGEVKVADFSAALSSSSRWAARSRMRGSGYVAPEQTAGGELDRRADIYALGVVLWEIGTGRPLVSNEAGPEGPIDIPPPSELDERLDFRFDAIVARATAPDPRDRYATAHELADALRDWLSAFGRPTGREELADWMTTACPDLGPGGLTPLEATTDSGVFPTPTETVAPPPPDPDLPETEDALLGRDEELRAMDGAIVRGRRVLCLSGRGGVGKTRAAVTWAAQVRDTTGARAVFCDAQQARTAEDAAHLVIAKLAPSSVQPRGSRDPVQDAGELLASAGPSVVVFDQLDQLLEEAGGLFTPWLERAPEAIFVITSREPPKLAQAEQIALEPLAGSYGDELRGPAADLFFARLEEVGGEEAVQRWRDPERLREVERVLRRLDGLPLAIVVTAARAANETPSGMAAELRPSSPGVVEDVTEAALRDAWNDCNGEERSALLQCSVFHGSFTGISATAVLRVESAPKALAALVDKSLLLQEGGRFRLHQSVRDLCASVTDPVLVEAARERHAAYFLDAGEGLLSSLRGPGAGRAFALLGTAEAELRGIHGLAVAQRDGDRAMRAALCLEPTLARRGDHRSLVALLELARSAGPRPSLAARGALAEARAHGWQFDFQPALEAANRGLDLAKNAGEPELMAEARSELAMVEVRCGQGTDAAKRYRDALAAMREAGDRRGEGVVLLRLANLLSEQGETQAATMMYRVALEASRDAQDRVYEGITLSNLGAQLLDDGRPDQAHQALYLSEEIFRELGKERYGAVSRGLIGYAVALQGSWEQGAEAVERAVETLQRIGERGVIVFFLGVLVSARARLGDDAAARKWAAHMTGVAASLRGTPVEHITGLRKGHIELLDAAKAAAEGDRVEATRLIESARARAQSAPRDVLTTLRIAAADLWEHSEQVEDEILPTRRRKSSLGRIRLVKRPDDP
ncbi:MAG: protein kinase [Sandaracinaceae bacterium]